MLGTPMPNQEETRANAAFAALARGQARPGSVETLPDPGEGSVIGALIN